MTDIETVEQMGLIDGPGTILRRAREAKGLDIEAIAGMLHLSEAKVNAIEADDFSLLPEPVFVRGYLMNYARLLEEPVDPVLDAYSKFGYESNMPKQTLVESDSKVEVNGDHDLVKIISVVVVVALIAIPIVVWWDDLAQVVQEIVSTGEAPQSELIIPVPSEGKEELGSSIPIAIPGNSGSEVTDESSVVEKKDRIETTIKLEPEQQPVFSAIKPLEPVKIETMPISIPQQTVEEEVKPEPKPIKESKPKSIAVATKPIKPAPTTNGVWFNFVNSGWVKVRDSKNRVILIGEHKKGTRKRLTSTMPYKVVLGNSNAVTVEIDGKIANIDRFSSGGVARFTIVDGKIDKP